MSLRIHRGEKPHGAMICDRRLYLTADKDEVVEADDARASFLFATPGYEIPAGDVERFGLQVVDGVVILAGSATPSGATEEATPAPVPEDPPAPAGDLPDDLPGREALVAAGLVTIESLGDVEDLTAIQGIGKATAARIREYLEESAD